MIDTSQVRDHTEEVEVANQPEQPVRKPVIQIFLNPDLSVSWLVDDKQLHNLDAVLHCLNAMSGALEADRDTLRAWQMQQRLAQEAAQQAQVQALARGPSYAPRKQRVH